MVNKISHSQSMKAFAYERKAKYRRVSQEDLEVKGREEELEYLKEEQWSIRHCGEHGMG